MKRRRGSKCVARGQDTYYCDGCKTTSTKCPYRDKFRDLRRTKKGEALYGSRKGEDYDGDQD